MTCPSVMIYMSFHFYSIYLFAYIVRNLTFIQVLLIINYLSLFFSLTSFRTNIMCLYAMKVNMNF